MIFHLFNAEVLHHVPFMIESVLKNAPETNSLGIKEHFFLLKLSNNSEDANFKKNQIVYEDLFKKYNTDNFIFISNSMLFVKYMATLSKEDKLIIHDYQKLFGHVQMFWFLLWIMGKGYRSRVSIILWGVSEKRKKSESMLHSILYKIQSRVFRSFKYVVALTVDDERKILEWHRLSNVLVTNYIIDTYNNFNSLKMPSDDSSSKVKIMVSHSAFSHNNHLEVFELLARFKDEDIQIICPLSYGNNHYREIVIEKGKEIFGDKFLFIDKIIPRSEYNELLSSVSIYISNAGIQTGLYAIAFCICTGKKLYLRDNNFNWMRHLGFIVNNVSELNHISYKEFAKSPESEYLLKNDVLARYIYSPAPKIEVWGKIYN